MTSEWPIYSPATAERISGLIQAGTVFDYSGGGSVLELEQAFSDRHEGRLALTFNSGTSALFAGFAALGLEPGDEVIVPNLTFLSTVSPLLWLGATPILCDTTQKETGMSPAAVERAITDRTRAIVVTHVFGFPVNMPRIMRLARSRGLPVVADCSHAHASTIDGRPVGVFGDIAVFSLGARKMVSGGHGGVLLTDDPAWRDSALLVGHFKPRARTVTSVAVLRAQAEYGLGGNLRMSPLSAALALDHLAQLDDLAAAKLANIALIDEALAGRLLPVPVLPGTANRTHFDLVYGLPGDVPAVHRDQVVRGLVAAGLPVRAPATRPLNRVLRAVAASPVHERGILWRRLAEHAAGAAADDGLPHSTDLHDRLISFPAAFLHGGNRAYAEQLAASIGHADWAALWG
ncbi:aminotransferase class I/II-fold pyridoxal phosphate-dependent enzyme [Micromonospora sp. BQ11]|uniref:aminotransferase class I/II-fold pyridoxal phosphate-dependent enzyme n=1 Tax=Micromonospora sp. BQ11 TaxID=3452212 RepID=UPI003F889EBD